MARDRSTIRFHQTADVPQAETIMTRRPVKKARSQSIGSSLFVFSSLNSKVTAPSGRRAVMVNGPPWSNAEAFASSSRKTVAIITSSTLISSLPSSSTHRTSGEHDKTRVLLPPTQQ
jgi:hypothetical protein